MDTARSPAAKRARHSRPGSRCPSWLLAATGTALLAASAVMMAIGA